MMNTKPMSLRLESKNQVIRVDHNLEISFRRTIRVPDNQQVNNLPPDLGALTLTNVSHVASRLPDSMRVKAGLLLPMHRIYISTNEHHRYAIKILIGGVNAISGEPETETEATKLRRKSQILQGKSIQDYVVIPDQLWLDGIATEPGKVRQFVATGLGKGHTVEGQLTGEEDIAGIQFEITPEDDMYCHFDRPNGDLVILNIRFPTGKVTKIKATSNWKIGAVKEALREVEGIPSNQQCFVLDGPDLNWQLENPKTLAEYDIQTGSKLHLVLRLRGGGDDPVTPKGINRGVVDESAEMGFAAGGTIKQSIAKDVLKSDQWDRSRTTAFNVQVLNAKFYNAVTGLPNPNPPLSPEVYASYGGVFYDLVENNKSDVHGDFGGVQSLGKLTGQSDKVIKFLTKKLFSPFPSGGSPKHKFEDSTSLGQGYGKLENAAVEPSTVENQAPPLASSSENTAASLTNYYSHETAAVQFPFPVVSRIERSPKEPGIFRSVAEIEKELSTFGFHNVD
ncbi:hypothetical protein TWF281_003992 [Arthrobotrys megalospora]